MAFIPRVYIGSDNISEGRAEITGSDANHILRVLRKKAGDTVYACDMHGNSYSAVIESVSAQGLTLNLGEPTGRDNEMLFSVTVYQCMPKGDKLDTVVQKAVELGASEIVAVMSERCVAKPDAKSFAKRLERLARISESAAAQCGRSFVPQVRGMIDYRQAISEISENDLGFICYEGDGTAPLPEILKGEPKSIAFLIGPEGGLSVAETELAKENNVCLTGLGKRILRTETASGYVLAAISVLLEL